MKTSHLFASWIVIIHRVVWRWPILVFVPGLVMLAVDPRHSLLNNSFLLGPVMGLTIYDVVREFKNPNISDFGFSSSKYAWCMYPLSVALAVVVALGDAHARHRQPAPLSLIVGLSILFALTAYLLRPRPAAAT